MTYVEPAPEASKNVHFHHLYEELINFL
jgi:hypothetical protein